MKSDISLKSILIAIALGIWVIVLQNTGLIPTTQKVKVMNTVDVSGSVDVDNTVKVKGSIDVDNTVDVNLNEVLGRPVGCRTSYTIDGREYQSIDVSLR